MILRKIFEYISTFSKTLIVVFHTRLGFMGHRIFERYNNYFLAIVTYPE